MRENLIELIFLFIYLAFLIYIIGKIFRYVKQPAKTFSWILVVIFIPIIGIIVYYLLGKSPRKEKVFHQKSPFYHKSDDQTDYKLLPKSKHRLIELLRKNNSAALSYGNQITILKDGPMTFQYLFSAMRSAEHTIHLDYYILEEGNVLDECINICEDKIKSGVTIRLIYDGFGTYGLRKSYITRLNAIGVECHIFSPFRLFKIFKFINYRNHRKIVIVDNKIAFTGGMNISDKYLNGDKRLGIWRDTYVMIDGPAAQDFERVFRSDWHYASGKPYQLMTNKIRSHHNGCAVQVIASGPDSEHKGIMHEYFTIITDAEEYVYMVTPYFIPGESLMTALKTSALSGIDVQLMLPYDSDSKWMKWCMFTYLEELLAAGVKILLFHDGFLHAKVIISDDIIASVGTANIDERSFDSNFEVNAIAYDQQATLTLKSQFMDDMEYCEELTLAKFPHRSDRNKIMEPIARLSSSIL